MAKQELSCPNCQGMVTLGEITCPHCGVNLKSGETYETQVKRAKGKAKHAEKYTAGLYAAIVLAVALFLFAGYMYQRSMEGVLADRPDLFESHIRELQYVEDLVAAGAYDVARERGTALVQSIQEEYDAITPETPFRVDDVTRNYGSTRREDKKWNKRGAKRLLANLKAKTEHLLESLPAS